MPNRILKESICTSCEIDKLTAEEERFFYRLIVNCDDFGRMDARPSILRAKCFPLKVDTITEAQIQKWLNAIKSQDLAKIYQVDLKPYVQITKWEKHQHKRAKYSKYPEPDFTCNQLKTIVPENRESRIENTRNEYGDLFDYLWSLYPRKKGKGSVSDTQKQKLYKIGKEQMERCVKRFKADMKKENRSLDKYPYGSTFFNSRYIDYLDENYQEEAKPKSKNAWDNLTDYTFKGKRPEEEVRDEKSTANNGVKIPDELQKLENMDKLEDYLVDTMSKPKKKG